MPWEVDMDKHLFVIAVAIVAVLLTTWLQVAMRKRELGPERKRLLWVLLAGGVIALVGLAALVASGS
jgi:hypothetical protein